MGLEDERSWATTTPPPPHGRRLLGNLKQTKPPSAAETPFSGTFAMPPHHSKVTGPRVYLGMGAVGAWGRQAEVLGAQTYVYLTMIPSSRRQQLRVMNGQRMELAAWAADEWHRHGSQAVERVVRGALEEIGRAMEDVTVELRREPGAPETVLLWEEWAQVVAGKTAAVCTDTGRAQVDDGHGTRGADRRQLRHGGAAEATVGCHALGTSGRPCSRAAGGRYASWQQWSAVHLGSSRLPSFGAGARCSTRAVV